MLELQPKMSLPDFSIDKPQTQWQRFCNLLWFNKDLGIWLDISRMNINSSDFRNIEQDFNKAIQSMEAIEAGGLANKDENRLVGHYWLRNSKIAPTKEIQKDIDDEIISIDKFGSDIIKGNVKAPNGKSFTDVFWIGIGGSGLGPRLIIEALQKFGNGLKIHFLDNVDPCGINEVLKSISESLETTIFVTVSKSGGTPEPRIGMEQARHFLEANGGNWAKQSVAITMVNSQLYQLAEEEGWLNIFSMPDWVGGRTSITSAVGLLPISLIQSDISEFLKGAALMDQLTREKNIKKNPASLLALAWWKAGEGKGCRDMVVLPYRDHLEVFSRYLQQLVMESLGKRYDRDQNIVTQGLSVYGNKGSTDQHAYVQQLRDGLDNYFATFIEVLDDGKEIIPINNQNPGDYLSGFLQGTRSALTEAGKQSVTITLNQFNEVTLGSLIALFERAVGIYAEIININAYHQPGVEAGKKAASEVLILKEQIMNLLSDGKSRDINSISNTIQTNSEESIFLILRHLVANNEEYISEGSWSDPMTLHFKKRIY